MELKKILAGAAMATIATAALAIVTLNDDGTGFVGKGDLQMPWNWNNAQMNSKASGVSFTYSATETWGWTCEWDTGTRNVTHHKQTKTSTAEVLSTLAYEQRKNSQGQLTGFNLLGFGQDRTVTGGDPPAVGDSCPETGSDNDNSNSNPPDKRVTQVDTTPTVTGGLWAHHSEKPNLLIYGN